MPEYKNLHQAYGTNDSGRIAGTTPSTVPTGTLAKPFKLLGKGMHKTINDYAEELTNPVDSALLFGGSAMDTVRQVKLAKMGKIAGRGSLPVSAGFFAFDTLKNARQIALDEETRVAREMVLGLRPKRTSIYFSTPNR